MKLSLPDVTLVCASSVCHELCEMSLNECLRHAEFGEIIVASDQLLELDETYRFFHADMQDCEEYCRWLLYELPSKLRTKHFLVVQWDSWITTPMSWSDEFLKYDYIGAPWQHRLVEEYPDVAVGNGGFSLRSTALAHRCRDLELPTRVPEDHLICYKHRKQLESEGFRFASVELASRFAFETIAPEEHHALPFGFHGAFNWWRVLSDEQVNERLKLLPPRMRDLREPQITLLAADSIMFGRSIDWEAYYGKANRA